jgi:hypothetical protein
MEGGVMTRTHPNWLTCQIRGIEEYILQCDAPPLVLRCLADDFRSAADAIEIQIAMNELTGHGRHDNDGVFG